MPYIAKNIVVHKGETYGAGKQIPLTDEEAKPLLADRAVALVGDKASETDVKVSAAVEHTRELQAALAQETAKREAAEKSLAAEIEKRTAAEQAVTELLKKLAEAEKSLADTRKPSAKT